MEKTLEQLRYEEQMKDIKAQLDRALFKLRVAFVVAIAKIVATALLLPPLVAYAWHWWLP